MSIIIFSLHDIDGSAWIYVIFGTYLQKKCMHIIAMKANVICDVVKLQKWILDMASNLNLNS